MNKIKINPGPIDEVLRKYRDPGTVFELGSGKYTTRGAWAFADLDCCMLAPGCFIAGAGRSETVIEFGWGEGVERFVEGKSAVYFEALTAGSRRGQSEGGGVSSLALKIGSDLPVVGLHWWASDFSVRDVDVLGVWGDRNRQAPNEGFGLLGNACGSMTVHGGSVVERCRVYMEPRPSENYCTGIYVGIDGVGALAPVRSKVRECEVIAMDGHAGYGLNQSTTIEDCECAGVRRAVFTDTGTINRSVVRRLQAWGCEKGVELWATESSVIRSVSIESCRFEFSEQAEWAQAVLLNAELFTGAGPGISNVWFCGNEWLASSAKRSRGRFVGSVRLGKSLEMDAWMGGDWQAVVLQKGATYK